jgi:hypothetical protein
MGLLATDGLGGTGAAPSGATARGDDQRRQHLPPQLLDGDRRRAAAGDRGDDRAVEHGQHQVDDALGVARRDHAALDAGAQPRHQIGAQHLPGRAAAREQQLGLGVAGGPQLEQQDHQVAALALVRDGRAGQLAERLDRVIDRRQPRRDVHRVRAVDLLDRRQQQPRQVAEVEVERRPLHAQRGGQLAHRQPPEPAGAHELEGLRHQGGAAGGVEVPGHKLTVRQPIHSLTRCQGTPTQRA